MSKNSSTTVLTQSVENEFNYEEFVAKYNEFKSQVLKLAFNKVSEIEIAGSSYFLDRLSKEGAITYNVVIEKDIRVDDLGRRIFKYNLRKINLDACNEKGYKVFNQASYELAFKSLMK